MPHSYPRSTNIAHQQVKRTSQLADRHMNGIHAVASIPTCIRPSHLNNGTLDCTTETAATDILPMNDDVSPLTPIVVVPAGRALKATMTYGNIARPPRNNRLAQNFSHELPTSYFRELEGSKPSNRDDYRVAAMLVVHGQESENYDAQFLISERKLDVLFSDALHWYTGDEKTSRYLQRFPALKEDNILQDLRYMQLPVEVLSMAKLATVTKPPPKAVTSQKGWDVVLKRGVVIAVFVGAVVSLWW